MAHTDRDERRARARAEREESTRTTVRYAMVFLCYGLLCLLTALYFARSVSVVVEGSVPASGGVLGPIDVPKDGTPYQVKVWQGVSLSSGTGEAWSAIDAELLDANQQFLFGFGGEIYDSAGRDSDGPWREARSSFDTKLTIPARGTHFLRFAAESGGNAHVAGEIRVRVSQLAGSAVILTWLGVISMLISIFLWYRASKG